MRVRVVVFGALLSLASSSFVDCVLAAEKNAAPFAAVACEGAYKHHLQGVCTDKRDAIYWSFTTTLVKTDRKGRLLKKIPVDNHHGDLCFHGGKIYVAVNLGAFNDPKGNAVSLVYVYDEELKELARHKTPQVFHGAGGIASYQGRFVVIGGLPRGYEVNYAYEYDADFKFLKRRLIKSGHTHLGIQTAEFADGHWWFGCYGDPKILLKTDADFSNPRRFEFDCSLGIIAAGGGQGRFLVATGRCDKEKGCLGQLLPAKADAKQGLLFIK